MPNHNATYFGSADARQAAEVLHNALGHIGDLWATCREAAEAVRTMNPVEVQNPGDLLQNLAEVNDVCKLLMRKVKCLAEVWGRELDQSALQALASTHAQEALLRQRIAHIDRNLQSLFPQLLALCQQAATSQQEWNTPLPAQPLHYARTHVALDYTLDEADAQFDDQQDNTLARQEAVFWTTGMEHADPFNAQAMSMRIHDNWLDCPHRWMSHQCWLTHDVLEHNYGQNPRMGLAALLRTGRIHVDVHTVRSYVYDLNRGEFVQPDKK